MRRLVFGVTAIVFASCGGQDSRISELEETTKDLAAKVESLREDFTSFKSSKELDDMIANFGKVAYLTPGAAGYSVIESDIVKLTVNIENIQPYANGSRVTLKFGNISSATINELKGKLEWGAVDENGSPRNDKAKSREITFGKPLRPGSWTNVQVVLEGIPPTELGFIRIRDLNHKAISLFN